MIETREVEVLESSDTSRAHSLVIEVCERNVSAKYQREGEVTSVEEGRDVERTTETVRVSTGVATKLARDRRVKV